MKSKKIVSLLLAGTMTAALLATPAQAAEIPQPEPYAIGADHWSREDFSQEANPEVFTGVYSRELYNAIRQTMMDGTSNTAPAYTMVADSEYSAVKQVLGRMEGVLRYEHHVPQGLDDNTEREHGEAGQFTQPSRNAFATQSADFSRHSRSAKCPGQRATQTFDLKAG